MMKNLKQSTIWMTGIAIFSMFFGAGNVIFPLRLAEAAGSAGWKHRRRG